MGRCDWRHVMKKSNIIQTLNQCENSEIRLSLIPKKFCYKWTERDCQRPALWEGHREAVSWTSVCYIMCYTWANTQQSGTAAISAPCSNYSIITLLQVFYFLLPSRSLLQVKEKPTVVPSTALVINASLLPYKGDIPTYIAHTEPKFWRAPLVLCGCWRCLSHKDASSFPDSLSRSSEWRFIKTGGYRNSWAHIIRILLRKLHH